MDISNSKFDDTMADILVGVARVLKKGDLIKVVRVKDKEPVFRSELLLLDVRGTNVGLSGLEVIRRCFKKNIKLLR